jgi:hypothetical protein
LRTQYLRLCLFALEEMVPRIGYSQSFPSVICIKIEHKLTPKSKCSVPSLFAVLVFAEPFQYVTHAKAKDACKLLLWA